MTTTAEDAPATDILHPSTITPRQWLILALCMMASMIEGFDIVVIAYAAPAISQDWGISARELGVVLSAGVFGMALGAMLLAWLADRHGRRLVVGGTMLVAGIATSAVIFTNAVAELAVLRTIAGLALGVLIATLPALVGEFSPRRHRTLIISVLIASANVGGFVGGLILAATIADVGWQGIFLYAGLLTVALGVLILWLVPESIAFTISRKADGALATVNRTLASIGQNPIAQLPPVTENQRQESASITSLLTPMRRSPTLLLWTAFFPAFLVVYFVSSWMPQILTGAGLSQQQAIHCATALPLGAIVGNLLIGWLAGWWRINRLIAAAFVLGCGCMAVLSELLPGLATMSFALIWTMLFIIGISVLGAFGNLYNVALMLYPVQIRGTGLGWSAGIGRAGAVISPLLAGALMGAGMSMPALFLFFAVPGLIAALCVSLIPMRELP